MAMSLAVPKSVELFYSYAHCDETLCQELQKHLTSLKRACLISDWYDRKIDPGSEWAPEIRAAMERAGLILLLISADFIASKYAFDTELPFALERHRLGLAKVIPVLLRPVEWRDLPFAALQMLPSKALPVTSWPNTDQAFYDIALRLRELIYGQRQTEENKSIPPLNLEATKERVLDAAIASTVVIDEPTDVVVLFRTSKSGGLRAILRLDKTYSPASEDVKSQPLEIQFPRGPSGKVLPTTAALVLVSPGFDPPSQKMQVRIPPQGDSAVFVFLLTPKRAGIARVTLQVEANDIVLLSQPLITKSVTPALAEPELTYAVVTAPVITAFGRQQFQEQRQQEQRQQEQRLEPPAQASHTEPYSAPPAPALAQAAKRSRDGLWIGIGTSAAATALLSVIFFIQPGGSSKPTELPAPPPLQNNHRETLAVTLSRLQEQTNSINDALKRQDLESNNQVAQINKRVKQNLQKADLAIRNRKPDEAEKYLQQTRLDLSTLEQITKPKHF